MKKIKRDLSKLRAGYRGIQQSGSNWQLYIDGKLFDVYETREDAARAWDVEMIRRGEFGVLNFPLLDYDNRYNPERFERLLCG